jgi:hypothetical protein
MQNMKKISFISIVVSVIFFLSIFSVAGGGIFDFEDGAQGWTTTGLWHWVTPSNSAYPNAHSGVGSFWYGDESTRTYDVGYNDGMLISPPLANPSILIFWTWWDIEGAEPSSYDLMQVIADDGSKYLFLQLNPKEDPEHAPDYDPDEDYDWYSSGGYKVPGVWVKHTVDLRHYPGLDRVVFYFDSGDSQYNDYYGWYIDDVTIYESVVPVDKIQKILKKNQDKN